MRRRVDIGPLGLSYLQWGDPDAGVLLLLHGFARDATGWAPVATHYRDRYRVIALDARGHGDSDWAPDGDYRYATFADDLEALCRALGVDALDLVAHSMGGLHATRFAARHPERVRALVLGDVGPRPRADVDATAEEFWKTPVHFASLDDALQFMVDDARRTSALLGEAPSEDALRHGAEARARTSLKPAEGGGLTWRTDIAGLQEARRHYDPLMVDEGQWPEVERLAVPTLVIRGGSSKVLHAEIAARMAEVNPMIEVAEIPGAGHAIHVDAFDEFCRLADAFLARRSSRARTAP